MRLRLAHALRILRVRWSLWHWTPPNGVRCRLRSIWVAGGVRVTLAASYTEQTLYIQNTDEIGGPLRVRLNRAATRLLGENDRRREERIEAKIIATRAYRGCEHGE
jgi:hypothetical protein